MWKKDRLRISHISYIIQSHYCDFHKSDLFPKLYTLSFNDYLQSSWILKLYWVSLDDKALPLPLTISIVVFCDFLPPTDLTKSCSISVIFHLVLSGQVVLHCCMSQNIDQIRVASLDSVFHICCTEGELKHRSQLRNDVPHVKPSSGSLYTENKVKVSYYGRNSAPNSV